AHHARRKVRFGRGLGPAFTNARQSNAWPARARSKRFVRRQAHGLAGMALSVPSGQVSNERGSPSAGAVERTRTSTPFGRYHLKVVRLPVPPRPLARLCYQTRRRGTSGPREAVTRGRPRNARVGPCAAARP